MAVLHVGIYRSYLLVLLLSVYSPFSFYFPVPILALIIASFGFYSDFFITFDRSNHRRIIRDAMYGSHPKVL